jgi:hypothetical protein
MSDVMHGFMIVSSSLALTIWIMRYSYLDPDPTDEAEEEGEWE